MKSYKFWSIYDTKADHWRNPGEQGGWLCIPPSKEYLPKNYPEKAVRKHEEELLPPPSYWLHPEYETIVYTNNARFTT